MARRSRAGQAWQRSTAIEPATLSALLPSFGSGAPRAWRRPPGPGRPVAGFVRPARPRGKMGTANSWTHRRCTAGPILPPGHDPAPDRCFGANLPRLLCVVLE